MSVSTNAVVPQFGDRLLVEVMDDSGEVCTGCRRLFAITQPKQFPLTFGIVPDPAASRVRARLYRQAATGLDGVPAGSAFIEATGRLPALAGHHDILPVSLALRMDCFGIIPGDAAQGMTCDPDTHALAPEPVLPLGTAPLAVDTWADAAPVTCHGSVADGMVCVHGGAFLLGSPRAYFTSGAFGTQTERLVKLSPFAMDVDEVTVGVVRTLIQNKAITSAPISQGTDAVTQPCTYLGSTDTSHDSMPVSCVTRALAEEVCAALGKRLPTEAEWEYAAGNLGDESAYPWGEDDDACKYAIVARGRTDFAPESTEGELYTEDYGCRLELGSVQSVPWGPVSGGEAGDVTKLGIRNLGGNLDEWVEDTYALYTDPCWQPGAWLLVDPICALPFPEASAPPLAARGGGWADFAASALAAARVPLANAAGNNMLGFRCASSM